MCVCNDFFLLGTLFLVWLLHIRASKLQPDTLSLMKIFFQMDLLFEATGEKIFVCLFIMELNWTILTGARLYWQQYFLIRIVCCYEQFVCLLPFGCLSLCPSVCLFVGILFVHLQGLLSGQIIYHRSHFLFLYLIHLSLLGQSNLSPRAVGTLDLLTDTLFWLCPNPFFPTLILFCSHSGYIRVYEKWVCRKINQSFFLN